MDKNELRSTAMARRTALPPDQRAAAARAIAERGLPFDLAADTIVAGYSPVRGEIDPLPLMRRLAARGAQLALPVVEEPTQPLTFRAFQIGMPLTKGPYGILEPSPDQPQVTPDLLLVPLAAFDGLGHRIGYGGGYYDRTLARLRAERMICAIGLAFDVQEVPAVPALAHDARLDCVLTQSRVLDFRGQ